MTRRQVLATFGIAGAWCALPGLRTAVAAPTSIGARLVANYGSRRGYRTVRQAALAWHHTTRNACVAFASTALREIGVAVPRPGPDGTEQISRLTGPFVTYLEATLGWRRVLDVDTLVPGDLAFTIDAPCCPGYPAHVVVFVRWHQRARRIAIVIDNGGRARRRPMLGDAARDLDAFAFAIRPA